MCVKYRVIEFRRVRTSRFCVTHSEIQHSWASDTMVIYACYRKCWFGRLGSHLPFSTAAQHGHSGTRSWGMPVTVTHAAYAGAALPTLGERPGWSGEQLLVRLVDGSPPGRAADFRRLMPKENRRYWPPFDKRVGSQPYPKMRRCLIECSRRIFCLVSSWSV